MRLGKEAGFGGGDNGMRPLPFLMIRIPDAPGEILRLTDVGSWFAVIFRATKEHVEAGRGQFVAAQCQIKAGTRNQTDLHRAAGDLGHAHTARVTVGQKNLNGFSFASGNSPSPLPTSSRV